MYDSPRIQLISFLFLHSSLSCPIFLIQADISDKGPSKLQQFIHCLLVLIIHYWHIQISLWLFLLSFKLLIFYWTQRDERQRLIRDIIRLHLSTLNSLCLLLVFKIVSVLAQLARNLSLHFCFICSWNNSATWKFYFVEKCLAFLLIGVSLNNLLEAWIERESVLIKILSAACIYVYHVWNIHFSYWFTSSLKALLCNDYP